MCQTTDQSNQKYARKQANNKHPEVLVPANNNCDIDHQINSSNGSDNCGLNYQPNRDTVIDLDCGDPTMYYPYWKAKDNECSVTIKASELLSYFAGVDENAGFYQMPEFTNAVRRVHRTVGNAAVEGRYIIGGTGSSQLFIVALRALASSLNGNATTDTKMKQIPVVGAEPYYSCYREAITEEESEVFQWRGDANTFREEGAYIEVVTSPNNPDGSCRNPVVKRAGGLVICDLAYYWPQYTPITDALDYDVMLFSLSKATGHAGSRIGWAIVKDKEIANKMIKQIIKMTIGISHESQLRATKLLEFVVDSYDHKHVLPAFEGLFEFGHRVLAERWWKLRDVLERSGSFSLQHYPPGYCNFFGKISHPNPAFAWMESKKDEDAAKLLNNLNIRARTGARFGNGVSPKFVRVSMLGTDEAFNLFLQRLSAL